MVNRPRSAAAETVIEDAGRDSLVNGDDRTCTSLIPEMDLPRISDARLVPLDIDTRLMRRARISQAA